MLELKNVCFDVYDETKGKEVNILNDVNLTIEDDSFLLLTGPNGGGKSSIAKIIMGIEKPTKGSIILDGEDITNMSITKRATKGIGFAFQQPIRFKGLYVLDLLRLSAGQELSTNEACGYLSQVGLCAKEYIDREINSSLSGGELKRIEIAMLIARNVKYYIYDEPEAGIDLWSFKNLVEVFERQKNKTKGSIVIISHQERLINIADKIAVVAKGTVTQVGKKEDIIDSLLNEAPKCCVLK